MSKARMKQDLTNFTFKPWIIESREGETVIQAYSLAAGQYQAIAVIKEAKGFPVDQIARFIVDNINVVEARECLIKEMISALEMCLESEDGKLNWSAEHDAEVVLRRAREKK